MIMSLAAGAAAIKGIEVFIAGVSAVLTAYGICKNGKKPK